MKHFIGFDTGRVIACIKSAAPELERNFAAGRYPGMAGDDLLTMLEKPATELP
jgi:hypothetical protein